MASGTWLYARGTERSDPVTTEQLKALIESEQVLADNLVWSEGMPQWARVRDVPALWSRPTSGEPMHEGGAGAIGYYVAGGGMPPRAVATLKGHARPAGDVGEWPLDDSQVEQYAQTLKLRKLVTGAASLYRLLFYLYLICTVLGLVTMLFALTPGIRRARTGPPVAGLIVILFFAGGVCTLLYFAYRDTMRAKRWAPLTMMIIFLVLTALNVLFVLLSLASPVGPTGSDITGAVIGITLVLVFGGAFSIVSWRSFAAIPKYLMQPAWCQELLIRAKL